MKILNVLLLGILCLLNSCEKECPKFDRSLLCWIPYNMNDTIKYKNSTNDTIRFKIVEKEIYDDNCTYGLWDKCSCASNASMYSEKINNNDYTIRERIIYGYNNSIVFDISVYINDKVGEFYFHTNNIENHITEELTINNNTYKDLIVIKKDTIEHPDYSEYWKIIIAKNIGILKIFGRDSIDNWQLIE